MVERAGDYPWSSARAHIQKTTDALIVESPLTEEIEDWESFISQNESDETIKHLRKHLSTGRPLGDKEFVERLEKITGRDLKIHKPGPKGACNEADPSLQFVDAELSD